VVRKHGKHRQATPMRGAAADRTAVDLDLHATEEPDVSVGRHQGESAVKKNGPKAQPGCSVSAVEDGVASSGRRRHTDPARTQCETDETLRGRG
jgi:hypothetical protein